MSGGPGARGGSSMHLGAKALHLFLKLELLSLELLQSEIVGGGPAQFILNGFFERLVARSEFTDPSFHGHDVRSPRCQTRTSEHPLCAAVRSHIFAAGVAGAAPAPCALKAF
jgi:hypothetical protein